MASSKQDIIDNLELLPEQIKGQEEQLLADSLKVDELILKQKTIETAKLKAITNDIGTDGKKTFSNELSRKIELERRLEQDKEYQAVISEFKELKSSIDHLKIAVEFLKRRFRAMESISRLGVN
jgi:predicted RNase H-like nuclease (RuvC/YqgF family)